MVVLSVFFRIGKGKAPRGGGAFIVVLFFCVGFIVGLCLGDPFGFYWVVFWKLERMPVYCSH